LASTFLNGLVYFKKVRINLGKTLNPFVKTEVLKRLLLLFQKDKPAHDPYFLVLGD